MERSIYSRVDASIICLVLLLLMLIVVRVGYGIRTRFWKTEEIDAKGGVNALLGALFGLWGFILAFTFSQSGSRFENVRAMMVDEANILRTAVLRTDLFSDSVRSSYRIDLKNYLEERISVYDDGLDDAKYNKSKEEMSKASLALWSRTVLLSKRSDLKIELAEMRNSLTSLFDIGIKREAILNGGVPSPISFLLIILALSICLVGGFTTTSIKSKEWVIIVVFAVMASTILYITIDLARPLQGLIRPDTGQKTLVELRKLF